VLVAGGTSNGVAQAGADLFLPAEFPDPFSWGIGQFAPAAAMNAARSTSIAGPSATEGYAVATGGGSTDVERYRFATIRTDKDDYPPGERALITGSGWEPNEEVTLLFQEDPAVHEDYVLTVTADGAGNISHDQWAPEPHDANVRFYLMATGQQSGRRAQMTFTDSVTSVTITSSPVTITSLPAMITVNFSYVTSPTGATSADLDLLGTGIPTITKIGLTPGTASDFITATIPAGIANGNYNVKVTVNNSTGSGSKQAIDNQNGGLIVAIPNVTVAVSPTSVTEDGVPNLVYTFSRTGSTTSALNAVSFSVSGTAQFSADYAQTGAASFSSSTGTVNFAAGSSTAVVTVDPSADSTFESNETVILTVSSGTGYLVGTPSAATGTITNDDANNTKPIVAFTAPPATALEGELKTFNFSITDPDASQTFSFVGSTPDCGGGTLGTFSIDSALKTGTFQCTFPDGPANLTVRVQVQDSFSPPSSSDVATTAIVVSNVAPMVTLTSPVTSANEGTTVTYSFTTSDPGVDTFSIVSRDCGANGTLSNPSFNATTGAGSFDCKFLDGPGTPSVSVQVKDSDDAQSNFYLIDVTVANVEPTIAVSGASNVNEGSSYSLTLGAVTDPGTDTVTKYLVHWGDGSSDEYATNGVKTHNYADGTAIRTITVDLTDGDGTFLDKGNAFSVTVDNVQPTILISGTSPINEGSSYSLTLGAVTDPGTDTVTDYVVHWGDGSSDTYNSNGAKTHTYLDGPNTYAITVDLVDEDGTHTDRANDLSVLVNNVAPTVSLNGSTSPTEGTPFTYSFSVSDPGTDTFSVVTQSCGSGALSDATFDNVTKAGSFKCTFPDGPADSTVSVQVKDSDDAASNTANVDVKVQNVAPTVTLSGATSADEGAVVSYSFTTSDPGVDTFSLVSQSCGAGGTLSNAAFSSATGTGSFDCKFLDGPAMSTVSVQVKDSDDAPSNTSSITVTVANVAPTVDLVGSNSANEGSIVHYVFTTTDPGADTFTVFSQSCGVNGALSNALFNATTGGGSFDCTFTDGPTTIVSVQVKDSDGAASNTDAISVNVANLAPTVNITAPTLGQLYAAPASVNLAASFTDPGAGDTHTCSIAWDDGSTTSGTIGGTWPNKTCTGTHPFGAAGVYTIQVTVTDDEGASDTESVMVVVYDPSAGFVTGGGTIWSPLGAYVADPTLVGKANFGFVSKYQKGAKTPTGQTEFQFQAGNLNFHGDVYQWLVVSGAKAQYKGTGSLNGVDGYGFLLTATDGQLNGGGGVDKFRIKITTSGGVVVYDNIPGPDDIDTSGQQNIQTGSIVIHSK
jgi:hypothetical protein